MPKDFFKRERKVFEREKERLLATSEGRFVLIKGTKVFGTFESQVDAIEAGYREFGNVAFYVKKIERVETPIYIMSGLVAF